MVKLNIIQKPVIIQESAFNLKLIIPVKSANTCITTHYLFPIYLFFSFFFLLQVIHYTHLGKFLFEGPSRLREILYPVPFSEPLYCKVVYRDHGNRTVTIFNK